MTALLILVGIVLVIVAARDRAELRRRVEALEKVVASLRAPPRPDRIVDPAAAHAAMPPAPRPAPAHTVAPAAASARESAAPAIPSPPAPTGTRSSHAPAAEGQPLDEWRTSRQSAAPPAVPSSGLPGWLGEFFSGGNLIVRGGVIVLFFGVAFLLRYIAEHSHLSIEWRLTGVAVAGLVLLALGWRFRGSRRAYALALQGGGVGILYLTVFAAFRLFSLLPSGAAFALLAAIAALSAILAILEDSMAFAMLGSAGGFLAPVLASTSAGNHVALFSYFAVLDLAVVAIAWYRSWRPLNLLAFVFTYGIGTAWGVLRYDPQQLATTEPFVILFFLMFVAIAVLFAFKRAPSLQHYVDGTLIFGTPVVSFGLQSGLVKDIHYALAYSALALGAFYLLLARTLLARRRESMRLLTEAFLALGIAFVTLAVPFALEGRWTAATWALEGAAALWIGLRQRRSLAVAAGLVLQLLAGIAYLWEGIDLFPAAGVPLLINSRYLGAMLIGSAGILVAARLRPTGPEPVPAWRPFFSTAMLAWGILWWLASGFWEMQRQVAPPLQLASGIAYSAATAMLTSVIGTRLDWPRMRAAALLLIPGLALFEWAGWDAPHPFAAGGWWAWPPALLVAALVLLRDDAVVGERSRTVLHTLALWLAASLAARELGFQAADLVSGSGVWRDSLYGLVPAAVLLVATRSGTAERWPRQAAPEAYYRWGPAGLAAWLLLFVLFTAVRSAANAAPLPYVPVLNPLDLSEGFALLAMIEALRAPARAGIPVDRDLARALSLLVALAAFLWLNALALRTLHHYAAVPYTLPGIAASTLAQTTLTIFWTVLALGGMALASRSGQRLAWIAGAVLLVLVTAKLFLIDLSRTGTIPRIVSFLGVGLLMLVIGYVSPLPPATSEDTDEA
jgi:uncharacterized membrane protein